MMDRIIEEGTPPLQRFKAGDRVTHISAGNGVVIPSTDGSIHVRYQGWTGIYDARWFELYPRFLFHQGTVPLPRINPSPL